MQTGNEVAKIGVPVNEAARSGGGSSNLLEQVLHGLDDAKAEDIVTIDLKGKSSIADTLVIASGRSQTHVGAIAEQLMEKLKKYGHKGLSVEGLPHCDWVLLDAGDIIIHIFHPELRAFYDLEKMWGASPPGDQQPNQREHVFRL